MFGVIAAAHTYLRGYAIDCVFTAIFFCFVGYFNGCGKTIFVMVQGLVGAFWGWLVRGEGMMRCAVER